MLMIVTFLILFTRFPHKISCSRACIPNTHIFLNGKLCQCDSFGSWSTSGCYSVGRRQTCRPGHVAIQGCTRCICQENGEYFCAQGECPAGQPSIHESLVKVLPWCNSFRTYYINCSICVCPASGKPLDARCAVDISCTFLREPSIAEISIRKNRCIPKVMYLFHCLHCLCPDDGYLNLEKCVERCEGSQLISRRCIPYTMYRSECNVCLCPSNSIPDDSHCTKVSCKNKTTNSALQTIKDELSKCNPNEFLKPKCYYCDCNYDGKVNKDTCLHLECLKKNVATRDTCSPGETVPFCKECLCTRSGTTSEKYCTKNCSYYSKFELLKTITALPNYNSIIDKTLAVRTSGNQLCKPNTVFVDQNKMCICPENGKSNPKLCIGIETKKLVGRGLKSNKTGKIPNKADFNGTCEPSTFVKFDCNSCFCSKKGQIDPKWCTYDDCEAKRIIQESHKLYPKLQPTTTILNATCNPGSISNIECNFCICPNSGLTEDRVCTKINCANFSKQAINNKFTCEPLAYYEVDCNVCFCAKDGIKNIAQCTKNLCENTFLRTGLCVAGQLFSDECNVCICPPNGNKSQRACTNNTCSEASAPWKKIFQLSQSLLGNHMGEYDDASRNLDLCFPGEEFAEGCKICVCPEEGLRIYAVCSPDFCEDKKSGLHELEVLTSVGTDRDPKRNANRKSGTTKYRKLNTIKEPCTTPNFTGIFSRNKCTPGSITIYRCKECICPHIGEVTYFCRPLPVDFRCEQAFPSYHYATTERPSNVSEDIETIVKAGNITAVVGNTTTYSLFNIPSMKVQHDHTTYECDKVANITDRCFKCECNGTSLIFEHCFQSDAKQCEGLRPSFLRDDMNLNSSKYDLT